MKSSDVVRIGERTGLFLVVLTLGLLVSSTVWAGGSGMPWESTLQTIEQSLTGPLARFVGMAAIFVLAISMVFGEGGLMKKGLAVMMGLMLLFGAPYVLEQMGFAGGALI